MGLNLNNPAEVRNGIDSLSETVKPLMSKLPVKLFLKKVSPTIKQITGYSVDELCSRLDAPPPATRENAYQNQGNRRNDDLYNKYKDL